MSRGGYRPNAGRKTKAKELQLFAYAKDAITAKYGSEQAFWEHIADQSMESLPHLKLLVEYAYGKPQQPPVNNHKQILKVRKIPSPQIVMAVNNEK